MEISGSLFPSGRNSGVFVKVKLPLEVLPLATSTARRITPRMIPPHFKLFLCLMDGFPPIRVLTSSA
jgi:hypothetical protein